MLKLNFHWPWSIGKRKLTNLRAGIWKNITKHTEEFVESTEGFEDSTEEVEKNTEKLSGNKIKSRKRKRMRKFSKVSLFCLEDYEKALKKTFFKL